MATVKDILAVKGGNVVQVGPNASAFDAARTMHENKIGCLVVMEGDALLGIISERDIMSRVVVQRRDPVGTSVREVMTPDIMCCHPHTTLEEARVVIKERRIRHLPVLDDSGKLCGMLSIGDLNAHDAHSKEMTIHLLHQYIYGPSHPSEPGA